MHKLWFKTFGDCNYIFNKNGQIIKWSSIFASYNIIIFDFYRHYDKKCFSVGNTLNILSSSYVLYSVLKVRKNVNHLTFLGTPPLFTVDKFTPSSLQFLSEVKTNKSIISLCSMDNGDLLVGTADNILQIRDSQLNTLFTQAIDGQLIDVSVMSNCPVSLVRVKEHMYVKLYSRNITCPEKIKEWSSSSSETGLR